HGGDAQLDPAAPFLTESFLASGYTTCAMDNLAQDRPWFLRGYEFYVNPGVRHPLMLGVTCEELNGRILPWLKNYSHEPFFMMLHYWDPHWPLEPPAKYQGLFYSGGNPTDPDNHSLDPFWEHPLGSIARDTWLRRPEGPITDARYVEAMYDQEVRHLDDGIGELLDTVDELGLRENTLVVLLADHGESLTEHGIFFDHHGLYDVTIHTPLIMRLPGVLPAGVRLPQIMQHQDVAPTILEATGHEVPEEMDGQSWWGLFTGETRSGGRDFAVSVENTWQSKWSLRTATHKFILARRPDAYGSPMRELYDLEADPDEEDNLVDEEPELADELEAKLEDWIAEQLRAQGKSEDPVVEQDVSLSAT
ncbi:MAG: sulfatase, partial [Chloroflexota bacterium]